MDLVRPFWVLRYKVYGMSSQLRAPILVAIIAVWTKIVSYHVSKMKCSLCPVLLGVAHHVNPTGGKKKKKTHLYEQDQM